MSRPDPERRRPRGRIALLAPLILLFATGAGASDAVPVVDSVRDVDLVRAIEFELSAQWVGMTHPLTIRSLDGVVTVSGRVDSLLDRDRALETVRATRGVRGIVDRIVVVSAPRDDAVIGSDVKRALADDPVVEDEEVDVRVEGGVVRLRGEVDSWQERRFANVAARGVAGVRSVTDEMTIDFSQERPDAEIRDDVVRRIAGDVRVDGGLVAVEVERGQVRLRGAVGSIEERERAYDLAWVTGVRGVDASGVEIRWWARDQMRRIEPRVQDDAEVERAVRAALALDPRVRSGGVEVRVENGVVTLEGSVGGANGRIAARENALDVVGVRRVDDKLEVAVLKPPTDADLARAVERRLAADSHLARHAISVGVRDGRVSLDGTVDSAFDRQRAEAQAGGVYGVRGVENGLVVESLSKRLTDPEILGRVRDALFWDARIDERWIEVSVESGVVTLTGWVDDWRERERAGERARAGGATEVRNRIDVKPQRAPEAG